MTVGSSAQSLGYDKKEKGLIENQPISFHYCAVDGERFIGEFQLRTELSDEVMNGIGSIGYAVKVSQQDRGYGTEILRQGLKITKEKGMERVLLNINKENAASIHVCMKLGGQLWDSVECYNEADGRHTINRYWIYMDLIFAHEFSSNHRARLMSDRICGCFYCLKIFDPKEIVNWIKDPGETAVCPYCGIDSLIGESSGYPITNEFLERMRAYWFRET